MGRHLVSNRRVRRGNGACVANPLGRHHAVGDEAYRAAGSSHPAGGDLHGGSSKWDDANVVSREAAADSNCDT